MSVTYSKGPVPTGLRTEEFILRPIVAADAEQDYAAVVETREHLRVWQQSPWPQDDFTVAANREDLAGLQERHRNGRAFTYTVLDLDGKQCLGCVYVFPTGASFLQKSTVTPVADDEWADVDVVVYSWVRRTQMEKGTDERLLAALLRWFKDAWRVDAAVFVVHEKLSQQLDVIERAELTLKFELVEQGKRGRYLVFG